VNDLPRLVARHRPGVSEIVITLHAKLSGAVYCYRSCLWRAGARAGVVCGCLWVDYHEIACIDLYQTGSVGVGSDYLQLIKFWPSRTPGKGVCAGAKSFGSALLQPASL